MTAETSYNSTFAPYGQWSVRQAPVPASVHNLSGTVAASGSAQTSLIVTGGYSLIAAGITMTQNGSMSVQRYVDAGGIVPQGDAVSVNVTANVAANLDVLDGRPFAAMRLTVTNSTGSAATISAFALLLQASDAAAPCAAVDGSTTITTGGTAQTLFGGIAPDNGFAVYNPDAVNDLWVSDSATAAANGQGSLRVPAGMGYESPQGYKPIGAVSIVGAATGQKITARRW